MTVSALANDLAVGTQNRFLKTNQIGVEAKLVHVMIRNFLLLFSLLLGVVTVTKPVVAPLGTTAVKYVLEITLKVATVPLNETPVVPLSP